MSVDGADYGSVEAEAEVGGGMWMDMAKCGQGGAAGERRQPLTPFVVLLSVLAALGGFLFGYDTGVISGAMLLLKREFGLSRVQQEVVVSVTVGAAAAAALAGGWLTARIGRRAVVVCASVVFTVGAAALSAAAAVSHLIVGRLVVGVGIGLASMSVPMYIAEAAPPSRRGSLVLLNQVFITFGQFVASVVDGLFSYAPSGWRYMLGLAAVPSIVQFCGFCFLPESPRWLIEHGHYEEARAVLLRIRSSPSEADEELSAIRANYEAVRLERQRIGGSAFFAVIGTPHLRRALVVGCALQLFQQACGINTVMYYSATIIEMAGVKNPHTAIWLASVTALVNFSATFIGLYLVDRLGRRRLTLGSLCGITVSLLLLALSFQLIATTSPRIRFSEQIDACADQPTCDACIGRRHCGFCFRSDAPADHYNGSCLTVAVGAHRSADGRCARPLTYDEPLTWTTDWCPTAYSALAIAGLLLYLLCFAPGLFVSPPPTVVIRSPGMGPMPWTINAEIYPQWARSVGNACSATTNWLSNLAVSLTFLSLMNAITKQGTYALYASISFCGLCFFYWVLPETKGTSLEDVEGLFSHGWFGPRPSSTRFSQHQPLDTNGSTSGESDL